MARKKTNNGADVSNKVWAVLRILIGFIMLWAFFDKLIGLGYATCRVSDMQTGEETVEVMCEKAYANGGSPTTGFLKFGTKGPLKDFYANMANSKVADFFFMAGLLLIGLSLVTGIGVKVAVVSGIVLLMAMWSAVLPGENNPVIDDHIIYSVALVGVLVTNKNQVWGLGQWWQKQPLVKKYPFLA